MEITACAAAFAPGGHCLSSGHDHLAFEQVFRERGRPAQPGIQARNEHRRVTRESEALETIIATAPPLLAEAATLVSERYRWRGYDMPGAEDEQPPSETLVALKGERLHGTLTLGFDGPRGLRADHTFGDHLRTGRQQGRMLVELSRLAVAPGADGRRVLSALFALAYRRGRVAHGATDLVVEVNPRHVGTYCRLFGFRAASDARECGRVRAPAVLLWLELRSLDRHLASHADLSGAPAAASGLAPRAARTSRFGAPAPATV